MAQLLPLHQTVGRADPAREDAQVAKGIALLQQVLAVVIVEDEGRLRAGGPVLHEAQAIGGHFDALDLDEVVGTRLGLHYEGVHLCGGEAQRHVGQRREDRCGGALRGRALGLRRDVDAAAQVMQRVGPIQRLAGGEKGEQVDGVARCQASDQVEVADGRALTRRVGQLGRKEE